MGEEKQDLRIVWADNVHKLNRTDAKVINLNTIIEDKNNGDRLIITFLIVKLHNGNNHNCVRARHFHLNLLIIYYIINFYNYVNACLI